ncbi:alpha-L-iduronidase [Anopheles aquasalis]|uniref:alpha-L-iduronidase n=1 Tax=Anopheles aquasalis TaxID=42839 RepID=UPI00215B3311|nr:alpha-L-iduronidase [Anopheles aquasalis]
MDVVAKVICRMYSSAIHRCTFRSHSLQQRTMLLLLLCVLICSTSSATVVSERGDVVLKINDVVQPVAFDDFQPLPPFWSSTGLCPPEPRNETAAFLLSKAMHLNLQLIGSLSDRAISYVRIHWLLELIQVSNDKETKVRYDFAYLDQLLDRLHDIGLYPGFELMGLPQGYAKPHPTAHFWENLVSRIVQRYVARYGLHTVARWRFESWNEPDLRTYNVLNFTVSDYLEYILAIRAGLDHVRKLPETPKPPSATLFQLQGPAGLFKAETHHPLCWAAAKLCNSGDCPFETFTFHRKGTGRWASEVLSSTQQLMEDLFSRFPNIRRMGFANDEADPVASWSTARPFQADVRYATMLFSIVAQHWSAMADTNGTLLASFRFLSHDNAFLSYHPYEFEQRTLLARFQMNETHPPHVQFIAKPVFSTVGMLATLGSQAIRTAFRDNNVSYILSHENRRYLCLLISRSNDSSAMDKRRSRIKLTIPLSLLLHAGESRKGYTVEALQDGKTDPFRLWHSFGRPAYPTIEQLAALRSVQFPAVLNGGPALIASNVTNLQLILTLDAPWIVAVRICSDKFPPPGPVCRVSVMQVHDGEYIIFWQPPKTANLRCLFTYEVWFKPVQLLGEPRHCPKSTWQLINRGQHTPFAFFQFHSSSPTGYYKVRAVDILRRTGRFSTTYAHG